MNKLKYIAAALIAIVGLGLQEAKATIIDSQTYQLTSPNTAVSSYPSPYISVTVDLTSSTTANITFNSVTSGGYTYLMIDGSAAAVNVNASSWTISNFAVINASTAYLGGGFVAQPAGYPQDGGAGNADGFGSLNQTVNLFNASDHPVTQISFTLTNTSGSWGTSASNVLTANLAAALAAAHIVVFNANSVVNGTQLATGYVANGGATAPDGGTTVMLLGIGLGALGVVRRYLTC